MLLALDLGNTNLTIGAFDGDRLVQHWRLSTQRDATADEYWLQLGMLLQRANLDAAAIEGAILASVVPQATAEIEAALNRLLSCETVVVDHGTPTGLVLDLERPSEIGADRIVNAIGALEKYAPPLIVVDFGTATTFDVISAEGVYLGGAIAPGVGISTQALFQRAAKLSRVELTRPTMAIGRNTEDSLRIGIVVGFAGQVDVLVRRIERELGQKTHVVATGGLAALISPESETIETVDPFLTLDGLRGIYDRMRGGEPRGR